MKGETSRRFRLTESLFSILIFDFFVCFSAVERYSFSIGGTAPVEIPHSVEYPTLWDEQASATFCLHCSRFHRKISPGKEREKSQQGLMASGLTLVPHFNPKIIIPVSQCKATLKLRFILHMHDPVSLLKILTPSL